MSDHEGNGNGEDGGQVQGAARQMCSPGQRLQVPDRLDKIPGKMADIWPRWHKRFTRYRNSSGLKNSTDEDQVSTLLYAMGDCADTILTTLDIDEARTTYTQLVDKINGYFGLRRNVIVERARFNRRVQGTKEHPEECMEDFISALYKLSKECEYGALREEFIRDRIVVGVKDIELSDDLQSRANLTLDDAVRISRQWEARKENVREIRGETPAKVDFVKSKPKSKNKGKWGKKQSKSTHNPTQDKGESCWFCGHERHARSKCPAKDATCKKCGKRGHYGNLCNNGKPHPTSRVHEVCNEEQETIFLGEISSVGEVNNTNSHLRVDLKVNGHQTTFKLDTGAAVSVISDKEPWVHTQPLSPSDQPLRGPGDTNLKVLGMFQATIKHCGQKYSEPMYVIEDKPIPSSARRHVLS